MGFWASIFVSILGYNSHNMTKKQAIKYLKLGESQYVEFKESLSSIKDAIKTLAAFGNQKKGGWLFFGVYDDGSIRKMGIGKNTIEQLANDIKQNTLSMVWAEPLIPEIFPIPDLSILALRVSVNDVKRGPYLAYGYRYKRSGKSTHKVKVNYSQFSKYYNTHLHPTESNDLPELNFAFCPDCGSKNLEKSGAEIDGDLITSILCKNCGWRQ